MGALDVRDLRANAHVVTVQLLRKLASRYPWKNQSAHTKCRKSIRSLSEIVPKERSGLLLVLQII